MILNNWKLAVQTYSLSELMLNGIFLQSLNGFTFITEFC